MPSARCNGSAVLLVLYACGACGSAVDGLDYAVDSEYVEILSDRYTFEGQPPVAGWGVVPAPCCVLQIIPQGSNDLLLMDSGKILVAELQNETSAHRHFIEVKMVPGQRLGGKQMLTPGTRLVHRQDGHPVAAVDATSFTTIKCTLADKFGKLVPRPTCTMLSTTDASIGTVHAIANVDAGAAHAAYIACDAGLFLCSAGGGCSYVLGGADTTERPLTAVAVHMGVVAAAGKDKIFLLDASSATVKHWEWVTRYIYDSTGAVTNVDGGVLDGPATSLSFDASTGELLAGNMIALNIASLSEAGPNASWAWRRIGPESGLPYPNINTVLSSSQKPATNAYDTVWIGTQNSVLVWNHSILERDHMSKTKPADPEWRYAANC